MSDRFFTRTRLALLALLIFPWLLLALLWSLSPALSFVLGVVAVICSFVALAFLFTPPVREKLIPPPATDSSLIQSEVQAQSLSIPTTLAEMYKMDPTDFEVFSAAVIIGGLNEGHRFIDHSGRRGDRGVDIRLQNQIGLRVVVQSKRYVPPRRVRPTEVRDFAGAIQTHEAIYGYFVTTSAFTSGALDEKRSFERIRTIDGQGLERLLQTRATQIAQAYDNICQQIQVQM